MNTLILIVILLVFAFVCVFLWGCIIDYKDWKSHIDSYSPRITYKTFLDLYYPPTDPTDYYYDWHLEEYGPLYKHDYSEEYRFDFVSYGDYLQYKKFCKEAQEIMRKNFRVKNWTNFQKKYEKDRKEREK